MIRCPLPIWEGDIPVCDTAFVRLPLKALPVICAAPCRKAGSFFMKIGADPAVWHNILWCAKKKPQFS